MTRRRATAGFTLLEVMMAIAILVVALGILVSAQATAVQATQEADRILVATQLAQDKLSEVVVQVEHEGFQTADVHDQGDFDDFGDEALDLELATLDEYHWEILVTEVDIQFAGGLSGAVGNLAGSMGFDTTQLPGGGLPDLSAFGISEESIAQYLQPFVREVKVRVWWGDDLDEAEELGNEVILTRHVIDKDASFISSGAPPQ